MQFHQILNVILSNHYRMNETVNNFSWAGEKCVPEMHLKWREPTYSACGPFTKNKERIQKFKETGDSGYICKNELHKACFQHDMADRDFKYLGKRTSSDKEINNLHC